MEEEDKLNVVSATETTGFMPVMPEEEEGESEFLTLCKVRQKQKKE